MLQSAARVHSNNRDGRCAARSGLGDCNWHIWGCTGPGDHCALHRPAIRAPIYMMPSGHPSGSPSGRHLGCQIKYMCVQALIGTRKGLIECLMALLNVRMGYWCMNPRFVRHMQRSRKAPVAAGQWLCALWRRGYTQLAKHYCGSVSHQAQRAVSSEQ